MEAALEISQHKGSDVFFDKCCSICEDDGVNKEGLFNCQKCSKYLCDSCVLTHNKFLKDHLVTAQGGGDDCPVVKPVDGSLELCEEHTTEKLTMFCEDDEKLLCHVCHLRNHRQCRKVVLLTDREKSTTKPLDVGQMKTRIESLMERLQEMLQIGEQNSLSLQTSYETVLKDIVEARRLINENLDRLQQNTERKLEELHSTLQNSMENIRKDCVEFISKINGFNIKALQKESPERSFIMYKKCLDRAASADLFLRKATTNVAIEFHHNTDLEQFLASCTEFGSIASREAVPQHVVDPNKIVSIKDKTQYNVRAATYECISFIVGICESTNREIIIADYANECVKLLDQAYKLIDQIQLPTRPWSMCKVSSDEMAVTVSNRSSVNEIHFLRVDKGRIVKYSIKLNHICYGIAIHQGDLFVTSGTALCQYTMDGRLVKTLYEDKSGGSSGCTGVGLSPDGKRIYVTDIAGGNLLTLTMDGTVTASLQVLEFSTSYHIPNLHVAATGQVFVYGKQYLSQVDTDGKKVLDFILLDFCDPSSVVFNENTRKMIVGFFGNANIIECKTGFS